MGVFGNFSRALKVIEDARRDVAQTPAPAEQVASPAGHRPMNPPHVTACSGDEIGREVTSCRSTGTGDQAAPLGAGPSHRRSKTVIAAALTVGALFSWGIGHGATAPNGAWLLAVALLAVALTVLVRFPFDYVRTERANKQYTDDTLKQLRQDTTGDHIWDA